MKHKWKRLGAGVLAAALTCGALLPATSAAASIQDEVNAILGGTVQDGWERPPEGEPPEFLEARYDFDAATGTLRKVVVSESGYLMIPEEIDGVPVRKIAPYAIQGQPVIGVYLPVNVEEVDSVIVADCPELLIVDIAPTTKVSSRVYENCPLLGNAPMDYGGTPYFELELFQPVSESSGSGAKVNMPQGLMKALGVFQGNGSNMNWDSTLTRVEAVTILLRLLGQEEEAQAAAAWESAFSDVPAWARGYVNLAYQQGMVKGVGPGIFNPGGRCGVQEFSLMLLRLTDYKEGSDYGWNTAVRDLQKLVEEGRALHNWRAYKESRDAQLFGKLYNDPLTRGLSCALLYRALMIPMADGKTSLADVLCAEKGLSTALMADFEVRITEKALGDKLGGRKVESPTLLESLMVAMDDEAKWAAVEKNKKEPVSQQIQDLTDQVTAGLSSDYEKAKAISKWISENIIYDSDDMSDGVANNPQDADSVLERRMGVCDGYAWLTNAMMRAAGIPCVRLVCWIGIGHASNEVYADGRWFPVDNTWNSDKKYQNGEVVEEKGTFEWFDMDYLSFYESHSLLMQSRTPAAPFFS